MLRDAIAVAISPSNAAGIRTRRTAGDAQTDAKHRATMLQQMIAPSFGHRAVIADAGTSKRAVHKATMTTPLFRSCTGSSAPKAIVIIDTQLPPNAITTAKSSRMTLLWLYFVVSIQKLSIFGSKSNKSPKHVGFHPVSRLWRNYIAVNNRSDSNAGVISP